MYCRELFWYSRWESSSRGRRALEPTCPSRRALEPIRAELPSNLSELDAQLAHFSFSLSGRTSHRHFWAEYSGKCMWTAFTHNGSPVDSVTVSRSPPEAHSLRGLRARLSYIVMGGFRALAVDTAGVEVVCKVPFQSHGPLSSLFVLLAECLIYASTSATWTVRRRDCLTHILQCGQETKCAHRVRAVGSGSRVCDVQRGWSGRGTDCHSLRSGRGRQ